MDFTKLPSLEKVKEIISELKSYDLEKVDENKLVQKIQDLVFIPFPTAILQNTFYVDRIRINDGDKLFTSEEQISYRRDEQNIDKYGRANLQEQSLFYGAFESEKIKLPRFVNLIETSEIFRDLENNEQLDKVFYATLGRWKLKRNTEVIEVIFSEDYLKSDENKRAFNYHYQKLIKSLPDFEQRLKLILEFFTSEFAKKIISSHHQYKLSAMYFNLSLNSSPKIGGVKYPSVKSDYLGYNLALLPKFLDENFELANVALLEINKKGKNTVVDMVNHVIDFGLNNKDFKWEK